MVSRYWKQPTRTAEVIDNLTLSNSLRPFWKFTRFTGILFDWCVITIDGVCKTRKWTTHILRSVRWFIITSSFIMIFLMFTYRSIQLVIAFREMSSVNSVTMAIVWSSNVPIAIQTQLFYVFHRKRVLDFFQQFSSVEEELAIYLPSQLNLVYRLSLSSKRCPSCHFWNIFFLDFLRIDLRHRSYFNVPERTALLHE